jgi:hypothetical protein
MQYQVWNCYTPTGGGKNQQMLKTFRGAMARARKLAANGARFVELVTYSNYDENGTARALSRADIGWPKDHPNLVMVGVDRPF